MTRKQVLVQLNDELLEQLDAAIATSGRSRSDLIRSAISDFLTRFLETDVDRRYVEAYTRIPDAPDPWAEETATLAMESLDAEDGGW